MTFSQYQDMTKVSIVDVASYICVFISGFKVKILNIYLIFKMVFPKQLQALYDKLEQKCRNAGIIAG